MPPMRLSPAWFLLLAIVVATPALAQETVVPKRNLRIGYAQVLRVEPVYQTLTATRMEQRCDGEVVPPAEQAPEGADCEMVPVKRELQRPIAYDVDYVYKGLRYRSRLAYDPGNRLRVQVSVQPFATPTDPGN